LPEQLRALFELGSKSTPSAVAAAKAKYDALLAAHARDPRIDYAYGVVLVNQHKYREASEVFARYLATGEPQLCAYCVQIVALVPQREYAKALEQAVALAERLKATAGSAPEANRLDAARFLGVLFKYLELPRAGAVDANLLKDSKQEVLALLGEECMRAYDEGANAVAKRLSEFQAQQNSQQEQLKEKLTNRKERDKQLVEQARSTGEAAEEKSQFTQEQLRELQQQYTELQKRITPFVMRRGVIQSAIAFRLTQLQQNGQARDPNRVVDQTLRNEIDLLEQQVRELDRQFAPLRASAGQLEARAAAHHFTLINTENVSRKSERLGIQANRRIERAEDKLSKGATAVDGKITLFSSYAPFSYDFERKRVLGWF
jgi:hypothetical protein